MKFHRLAKYFSQKKMSYLKGDHNVQIIENSLSKQLFLSSLDYQNEMAFISDYQNIGLTYSELFNLSKRMAANMLDLGVKPGSRLGIYSPNNIEWALCQYSSCLADVIMVNINPAYKPNELEYGINLVELETLIVSDNVKPARLLNNVEHLLEKNNKIDHCFEKSII